MKWLQSNFIVFGLIRACKSKPGTSCTAGRCSTTKPRWLLVKSELNKPSVIKCLDIYWFNYLITYLTSLNSQMGSWAKMLCSVYHNSFKSNFYKQVLCRLYKGMSWKTEFTVFYLLCADCSGCWPRDCGDDREPGVCLGWGYQGAARARGDTVLRETQAGWGSQGEIHTQVKHPLWLFDVIIWTKSNKSMKWLILLNGNYCAFHVLVQTNFWRY